MKQFFEKQIRKILFWIGIPFVFGLMALLLQGAIPGCRFLCQLFSLCCGYWIITCVIYSFSKTKKPWGIIFKVLFWVFVGAVLLLAILFFTVEGLIFSHSDGDEPIPATARVLLVLGCQVEGEAPSKMLANRIDAACAYLSDHPDAVAILCGGQGGGENISEAECMYRVLISRGIDANRLICENRSIDTEENIAFAAEILRRDFAHIDEVIVVSNGFHLFRAKLLCAELGLKAYGIAGEMPNNPVLNFNFYLREFAGIFFMYADRIFA